MGESKRRKQILGKMYGKPLALSRAERISLIEENMAQWISEHFDNCEYDNYLENPITPQIRNDSGDSQQDLKQVIKNAREHFAQAFDDTYPETAIKLLVTAILEDRPLLLEGISSKWGQKVEPKIALPLARKYFQRQVESRKIELSTHHVLVKEALTVLGRETLSALLEQLLWGEFNEVITSAKEEKSAWLMKNINTDGWINLNEEVVFQSVNQAITGILTMVVTLPWSMQLRLTANQNEYSSRRSETVAIEGKLKIVANFGDRSVKITNFDFTQPE